MRTLLRIALVFTTLGAAVGARAAVPGSLSFVARISDAGQPIAGAHDLKFTLYNDPTASGAGSQLWTETQSGLTVQAGVVATTLGAVTPLNQGIFAGGSVYLEIAYDGTTLSPRLAIQAVPYAMHASVVEALFKDAVAPALVTLQTSVTNVLTLTFSAPTAGFALVTATGHCSFPSTGATLSQWSLQIGTTPAEAWAAGNGPLFQFPSAVGQLPFSAQRVLPVTAGTNSVYLNGQTILGGQPAQCQGNLVAIFSPSKMQ